jgi:putative sigma-54 modulation protein
MVIEYTGRGTTIYPKLKIMADSELERIERMVGTIVNAHVILTEDKYRKIAEVTLQMADEVLVGTCEGEEMQSALHDALKKVEHQALKNKERRLTAERQAKPNSAEPLIEVASPGAA